MPFNTYLNISSLRLFTIAFTLFLLGACPGCKKPPPQETPPPTSVTAWTVKPINLPVVWKYIGFTESSHTVQILPRVEGYLQKINYLEGSIVQQGSLLFQIDPTQFQAVVERAQGAVARQEALLTNAILTVERLQPLYEQKAASKKDLDQAISQKLSAQASLQSAQATLLNAQINLGYTSITSPVTGLTDRSQLREGALVTPGVGSLLTTLSVIDPIWIYFTVSDNDILRIKKQVDAKELVLPPDDNYEIELVLSDGSRFPYKGKVSFNSPTYNRSTGTMLIRSVFPNPAKDSKSLGALHPGQFVEVHVLGATRPAAVCIPKRALVQRAEGLFVYLIAENGTVHPQDVEAGEWEGELQCIRNGLKEGDRLVVDGINKIAPSMPVHVVKEWEPPALQKNESLTPTPPAAPNEAPISPPPQEE